MSDQPALPPKPIRPADEDCCRSDCPNCVFTLYDEDLERWQAEVKRLRAAADAADRPRRLE